MKALNIGFTIAVLAVMNLTNHDFKPSTKLNGNESIVNNNQEEMPVLSFSSSVKFGKQENQLSILVSTDFNGEFTEESIKKASWKTVGKTIKLATGEESENSGPIDLQPLVRDKKTYYLAFKYTGNESVEGKPTQRTWTVNNVKLGNQDLTSFNIINSSINDEKTGWTKLSSGGVVFRPAATLKKSEGWAIIKVANL